MGWRRDFDDPSGAMQQIYAASVMIIAGLVGLLTGDLELGWRLFSAFIMLLGIAISVLAASRFRRY